MEEFFRLLSEIRITSNRNRRNLQDTFLESSVKSVQPFFDFFFNETIILL